MKRKDEMKAQQSVLFKHDPCLTLNSSACRLISVARVYLVELHSFRDGSVSIETGYGLMDRSSTLERGVKVCLIVSSETVPPNCEVDHPPASNANVKIALSHFRYVFMAWYLIKHRENFTVYTLLHYSFSV